MLITAKRLSGYKMNSVDGEIGRVKEFYFDDQHWTVRYLVADTGNWLTGRQVLISPYALGHISENPEGISVNLTKKQIEGSPSLGSDKPVSKQFEADYYGYYEWPVYWSGPALWGSFPYITHDREKARRPIGVDESWDPHLRSTHDVGGHGVQARDGEIGHVEDFLIDDRTWTIRYLIVDTHNWWPGKKVLVSPRWIERVSWDEAKVFINLSREAIKTSPEYTEENLVTRNDEIELHKIYNRPGYWDDEPAEMAHSHEANSRK